MCQLDSFKALGSTGLKGKKVRVTPCLTHAMVCTEHFLAFGSSSEESPEKEGSVFCIWKVLWWIYHSGSDCGREECTPDGLWNSARGTSAAPLQSPEPWEALCGKAWGPLQDSPGFVLKMSEESVGDSRTGNDTQLCWYFKLLI